MDSPSPPSQNISPTPPRQNDLQKILEGKKKKKKPADFGKRKIWGKKTKERSQISGEKNWRQPFKI